MVNNSDAAVQALNTGGTLTDTFTYTVKDPGGLSDTAQLTITINGADDAPVAFNDIGSALIAIRASLLAGETLGHDGALPLQGLCWLEPDKQPEYEDPAACHQTERV